MVKTQKEKQTPADTSLEETVIKIIADHLGLPTSQLKLETKIKEELGADELDLKELIITVEERYGTRVEKSEVDKIQYVGDIVEAVRKHSTKTILDGEMN